MSTVTVTTTPTQINDGTAPIVFVSNRGDRAVRVFFGAVEQEPLPGGFRRDLRSKGAAITVSVVSGTGSLNVDTVDTTPPTRPPWPVTADVRDWPSLFDADDASAQIQAALNSGASFVTLGDTGSWRAAVTVPAGVTLTSAGAKLRPAAGTAYIARTGGAGASIVGVAFDFTADSNLLGGERAVQVRHDDAVIDRCSFSGNGYRYGVLIQGVGTDTCHNPSITRNRFANTSYGVLKQGGSGTRADNIEIVGNRFKSIRRGDAVELNVGADSGHIIERNWIDDVTGNGVANAGIGIGVAGSGIDPVDLSGYQKSFSIAGNIVTNTDFEAIHVEVAAYFTVERNIVEQRGGMVGTGKGITIYGGQYGNVKHNTARNFDVGIFEDLPVSGGSYVAASTGQIIESNDISGCTTRGIFLGTAGEGQRVTARKNVVRASGIGIEQHGSTTVVLDDNDMVDCPVPLKLDMNPVVKSSVAATYTRILHATNNRAYRGGLPQPLDNVLQNLAGAIVYARGNNFPIVADDIADHHQPGDIVIDGGTAKVCLTPGWTRKNASTYYFTATAGNNYVVIVAPGDPAATVKVGQMISLPGAGPGGATLKAYIQRLYIASSEYRIQLDRNVGTTVSSSTVLSLAQAATYATLA